MSPPTFIADASQAHVLKLLSVPRIHSRLADRIGQNVQVTHLGGTAFRVTGAGRDFVLHFPQMPSQWSMLQKEERVRRGLRGRRTALNPQDLVNVLDNLKRLAWGKVCIVLDVDRPKITAFGTPDEIEKHIANCVRILGSPQGG